MKNEKKWKVVSIFIFISGIGSAAIFALYIVMGGILDPNYNQMTDSISALTDSGAPNQGVLISLYNWYGLLYILFAVLIAALFWRKTNKLMSLGSVLLAISAIISRFGVGLFLFNSDTSSATFNNMMHFAVVSVVYVLTIASMCLIATGNIATIKYRGFGIFLLLLTFVFALSGSLSTSMTGYGSPYIGFVEKASIGTLQIFVCSLSVFYLKIRFIAMEGDEVPVKSEDWL
ncbi:MAG: DUF998 domain-containing protein [Eubacteriales bacterium]